MSWAARLHEIGLTIAHNAHHKHGGYLLANSDLPGFSRREQRLLAVLVRGSRRKFPASAFKPHGKTAQRLGVLLRLAILLHRSRSDAAVPERGRGPVASTTGSGSPGWRYTLPLSGQLLVGDFHFVLNSFIFQIAY